MSDQPTIVEIYECYIYFVYDCHTRDGEKVRRESSMKVLFTALDLNIAIRDGVRAAKNINFNDLYPDENAYLCCVKIYRNYIGPINEKGESHEIRGFTVFEWKCDWPGSLQEYVKIKTEENNVGGI